jgi:hypothetical protein
MHWRTRRLRATRKSRPPTRPTRRATRHLKPAAPATSCCVSTNRRPMPTSRRPRKRRKASWPRCEGTRGFRQAGQAAFPGSGFRRERWRPRLVHPRCNGQGLRRFRVRHEGRADFGAGALRFRFSHHSRYRRACRTGKALEEVRAEIAAELKREPARRNTARRPRPSATWSTSSRTASSRLPTNGNWKSSSRPGWPRAPSWPHPSTIRSWQAAVFADDAVKNKRNTEAVEVAPGVLVSARVTEHKPAAVQPWSGQGRGREAAGARGGRRARDQGRRSEAGQVAERARPSNSSGRRPRRSVAASRAAWHRSPCARFLPPTLPNCRPMSARHIPARAMPCTGSPGSRPSPIQGRSACASLQELYARAVAEEEFAGLVGQPAQTSIRSKSIRPARNQGSYPATRSKKPRLRGFFVWQPGRHQPGSGSALPIAVVCVPPST